MAHPFATLLIPARAATPAMPERVVIEFSAVSEDGIARCDIQLSDCGNLHFVPSWSSCGGQPLRISLVDIANACLKASTLRPEGAA